MVLRELDERGGYTVVLADKGWNSIPVRSQAVECIFVPAKSICGAPLCRQRSPTCFSRTVQASDHPPSSDRSEKGVRIVRVRNVIAVGLWVALGSAVSATAADGSLPWAFNAPAAEGYSIKLISVEPTPGTPLVRGAKVSFKVSVSYSMVIAKHGKIVLVFQDEKNGPIKSDTSQVSQEVSGPDGVASLQQTVTVPPRAHEVRLFIPLVPDGIANTTGEVTLRYPVVK